MTYAMQWNPMQRNGILCNAKDSPVIHSYAMPLNPMQSSGNLCNDWNPMQ